MKLQAFSETIYRDICKGYLGHSLLSQTDAVKGLTATALPYIIKKYAEEIQREDPAFPKHVHCHMFQHSKAMHMLEAGINIIYIRGLPPP